MSIIWNQLKKLLTGANFNESETMTKKKNRRRNRNKLSLQNLFERKQGYNNKAEAMPVVEQCEPLQQPLPSVAVAGDNTLEFLDQFKMISSTEDSDEESFHLPMLDDDEVESRDDKSTHSSEKPECQNGETEDDILNKFDTVGSSSTPDFDAKTEDSILDEADDMVDNQMKKNINSILDNLDSPGSRNNEDNSSQKNVSLIRFKVNVEYKVGAYEWDLEGPPEAFMSKYEYDTLDKDSLQWNNTANLEDTAEDNVETEENLDEQSQEPSEICEDAAFSSECDTQQGFEENVEETMEQDEDNAHSQDAQDFQDSACLQESTNDDTQDFEGFPNEESTQQYLQNALQSEENNVQNEVAQEESNTNNEFDNNMSVEEQEKNPEENVQNIEDNLNEDVEMTECDNQKSNAASEFQDDDVDMPLVEDNSQEALQNKEIEDKNIEETREPQVTSNEETEFENDRQETTEEMQTHTEFEDAHESEDATNINEDEDIAEEIPQSEEKDAHINADNVEERDTNEETEFENDANTNEAEISQETRQNDETKCQEVAGIDEEQPEQEIDEKIQQNEEAEECSNEAESTEEMPSINNEQSEIDKEAQCDEINKTNEELSEDLESTEETNLNKAQENGDEINTNELESAEETNLSEAQENDNEIKNTNEELETTEETNLNEAQENIEKVDLEEQINEEPDDAIIDEEAQQNNELENNALTDETVENVDENSKSDDNNEDINEDELLADDDKEEQDESSSKQGDDNSIVASEENSNNVETDPLLIELEATIKSSEEPSEKPNETGKNEDKMNIDEAEDIPKENTVQPEGPEEEEPDLLDISIVRDTEEDDACAIQTAIEDNQARIETENEDRSEETTDVPPSEEDQGEQSENLDAEIEDSFDDRDDTGMDFDETSNECGPPESIQSSSDVENKEEESRDEINKEENKQSEIQNESVDVDMVELGVGSDKDKTEDKNDECVVIEESGKSGRTEKAVNELLNVVDDKNDTCQSEVTSSSDKINEVLMVEPSKAEEKSEVDPRTKSSKRSLSASDETDVSAKKMRLSEPDDKSKPDEAQSIQDNPAIKSMKVLKSFFSFMQNKKFKDRLTRSDLEQFCLQKVAEVMWHKTTEGELHQTIAKQGQLIEQLKKDMQQLTKQAKDLETVNKKLINELRSQNGTKKPLVPLKITRSVGLQVRLGNPTENLAKRKQIVHNVANSALPPGTPPVVKTVPPAIRPKPATPAAIIPGTQAATPVAPGVVTVLRQSPQKQATPQTIIPGTNPLLTQALSGTPQRRAGPATPPKRPAVTRPVNTQNTIPPAVRRTPGSSVIDLTDEDDKAKPVGRPGLVSKAQNASKVVTVNKASAGNAGRQRALAAVPQNVRLAGQDSSTNNTNTNSTVSPKMPLPIQDPLVPPNARMILVKNGSIAIPSISTASGTQLMYVPLSTITSTTGGPKTVFLNLQPTNGVIGKTPIKNTFRKHPAPLPCPPRIAMDPKLKPVPPKPHLSIRKTDKGIILQWKMPYNLDLYESIYSYQLYAYQETNQQPSTDMWRKVGDVKALALPMACTLTQFADKNKYYFAVRSVDIHKRIGAFSDPEEISL